MNLKTGDILLLPPTGGFMTWITGFFCRAPFYRMGIYDRTNDHVHEMVPFRGKRRLHLEKWAGALVLRYGGLSEFHRLRIADETVSLLESLTLPYKGPIYRLSAGSTYIANLYKAIDHCIVPANIEHPWPAHILAYGSMLQIIGVYGSLCKVYKQCLNPLK